MPLITHSRVSHRLSAAICLDAIFLLIEYSNTLYALREVKATEACMQNIALLRLDVLTINVRCLIIGQYIQIVLLAILKAILVFL